MITEKDRVQLLQVAGAIACNVVAMPYNLNCSSKQIAAISVGIACSVFDEIDKLIKDRCPTYAESVDGKPGSSACQQCREE